MQSTMYQRRRRAGTLQRVALKRPKIETERIIVKCSPEKKRAYNDAAEASEQRVLGRWIKAVLDRELKRLKRGRK